MSGENSDMREIKELFEKRIFAVLATGGEQGPYTSLIGFAFTDDLRVLVFFTSRETRKFRNLSGYPLVSLLVSGASNRTSDFFSASAVTVTGEAFQPEGKEKERFLELYVRRFPFLNDIAGKGASVLIGVKVKELVHVSGIGDARRVKP